MINPAVPVPQHKPRPALRLVKTIDLPREEWLDIRKTGIGSSDAAAAVGLNPYKSPLELWLEKKIPSLEERVDHILTQQVFGIGITHLTSLLARRSVYCSKYANGAHSIAQGFASDMGNIWFERTEHTWAQGKCKFCGASQAALDRGEGWKRTPTPSFIPTTSRLAWPSCLEQTCNST